MFGSSRSFFLQVGVVLSTLTAISFGCGLPPAPAPPPPMCCPCAPPAPPPSCCPCPPPPPPPPPSCGGGCAALARRRMYNSASLRKYWRNKREADNATEELSVQEEPQFKNGSESPCPMAEWAPHMRQAIIASDPMTSVHRIQAALLHEMQAESAEKFLVTCANAEELGGGDNVLPEAIGQLSSSGTYCNVRDQQRSLWCQAVAVSA